MLQKPQISYETKPCQSATTDAALVTINQVLLFESAQYISHRFICPHYQNMFHIHVPIYILAFSTIPCTYVSIHSSKCCNMQRELQEHLNCGCWLHSHSSNLPSTALLMCSKTLGHQSHDGPYCCSEDPILQQSELQSRLFKVPLQVQIVFNTLPNCDLHVSPLSNSIQWTYC
jgi:hypothetical protein